MDRVDLKILGAGANWITLAGKIVLGLTGYGGRLPKGSTAAVISTEPGQACLDGPRWIAEGKVDMAITSPDWLVRLAVEGKPPFEKPLPLKLLAVFPHDDRMAFAVRKSTGLRSFSDLRERKYPLKISMVSPANWHPALFGAMEVLRAHGITLEDIQSWGGEILSDRPRFINDAGAKMISTDFDAVFDEALSTRRWHWLTENYDLHFLALEAEAEARLVAQGWEMGWINAGQFRGVDQDVRVADFSGWALACHQDMDDDLAFQVLSAIDEQKAAIDESFPQPFSPLSSRINMDEITRDLPVALHPGAERYRREHVQA